MKLFEKVYDGESLIDIERDVWEALDPDFNPDMESVSQDEHGFLKGDFKVTIEHIDN